MIVVRPSYEGSSRPACGECPLHLKHGRSQASEFFVPADLRSGKPMLIGEAPGRSEMQQGLGFVGEAGQELWRMLGAMGLTRDDFSVTNVLKCQPPKNKFAAGGVKAVRACSAALRAELGISRPPFVVALGNEAMRALTGTKRGITELRGQKLTITAEGFPASSLVPVFPTFHPSYFVRTKDPGIEEAIIDDLIRALDGKPQEEVGKKAKWQEGVQWNFFKLNGSLVLDTESFQGGDLRLVGASKLEDHTSVLWKPEKLPPMTEVDCLIFHFARHDYCLLRRLGVIPDDWQGEIRDTILMAQLLDENRPSFALKTWAQDFGYGHYWKEVHGYWARKEDPPEDILLPYCATDVALTRDLYQKCERELDQRPRLRRLHDSLLVPSLKLLAECELNGIQISPRVIEGRGRIRKRIRYHERKIVRAIVDSGRDAALAFAGFPEFEKCLNKRLFKQELFFNQLRLFTGQMTPGGQQSMDKRAMQEMERLDSTGIIHSYRQRERYLTQRKLLKQIINHGGKLIHPKFNLGGKGRKEAEEGSPVTGRLSAQDPNTQQFPEWMRVYVVSRYPQGVILKWDAKQLEIRVAYEYSRDPALIEGDAHQLTADWVSKMFRPFTRAQGKTANFAVIFGAEVRKLMDEFNLSEDEATQLRRALMERFPIHFDWIRQVRQKLKAEGQIESLCGRVRRLPLARGGRMQHHALNQGVNFPIQCFANTLNLLCALHLGPRPRGGLLVNLVHDEGDLDMETRSGAIALGKRIRKYWRDELAADVKKLLGVDLVAQYDVDILIGPSWGELEQIA